MEKRIDKLEKIDVLKGNAKGDLGSVEHSMRKGFNEMEIGFIEKRFSNVIAELQKLNRVTQYEEEYENLKKFEA